MSEHVAILENRDGFDPQTIRTQEASPGVQVVTGCRHGSRTSEGIEYRFSAETFAEDDATAWCARRGVFVRSFAAAASDALTLEDDGTYTLRGIECAEEGTWYADVGGKVELTAEMLDNATDETNAAIGLLKPALTLGHLKDGKQWVAVPDGGQPRLGFASKFYRRGKKVLCDLQRVPPAIVKAIRLGMWGRISPDLMLGWPDPNTKERRPIVFTALALLGATPPAISTLQDLSDWIDGQTVAKPATAEMALSLALSDVVSVVSCEAAGDPGINENPIPDDKNTNQGGVEVTPELKAEIMAMIEASIAKALGSAGGEADMAAKKEMAAMRTRLYDTRLKQAAKEGKIKAGEIATMAPVLIEMSAGAADAYLDAIDAREGQLQPTNSLGNGNKPTADPMAGLKGEAKLIALAQAKGGDFAEAFHVVCLEHPDDYNEYRAETFKVRSGGDA